MAAAAVLVHQHDLPSTLHFGPLVAVDTETMGLDPRRDRLCLVQLSNGDGHVHCVQLIPEAQGGRGYDCPNLKRILSDRDITKLFHFARFDMKILRQALDITVSPVRCTKIASKFVRTFTDRHGLKDLCRDLLGIELSKQQQSSDWGNEELTSEQIEYAASDVLYLHDLWNKLELLLKREGRLDLAERCFAFLPTRAQLDLLGYDEPDIFCH